MIMCAWRERCESGDYTHAVVAARQYRDDLTGLSGQLFTS